MKVDCNSNEYFFNNDNLMMCKEWISSVVQRKVMKRAIIGFRSQSVIQYAKRSEHDNGPSKFTCIDIINEQQAHHSHPSIVASGDNQDFVIKELDKVTYEDTQSYSCVDSTSSRSSISSESEESDSSLKRSLVAVSRPITDYWNNFTEFEANYLTELLNATRNLKTPFDTITSQASTFHDALHAIHCAIRPGLDRNMSAFKQLTAFNDISKDDRYWIVRPGIMAAHILRSITRYFTDGHTEYITVPTVSFYHTTLDFWNP